MTSNRAQRRTKAQQGRPVAVRKGDQIEARFVRSSTARTFFVDGAWGGTTAQGNIHASLYVEHQGLPEGVVYRIEDPETGRADEMERRGTPYIVRDIEAELVMTPAVARSIAAWLLNKAAEAEKLRSQATASDTSGAVDGTELGQ